MEWCETPKADMDCLVSKEAAAQIHVSFMGQGLQPEALEQRRLKGDYAIHYSCPILAAQFRLACEGLHLHA